MNVETPLPNHQLDAPLAVEKSTYMFIFVALILLLMFLPFVTTFNEILTKIVEKSGWYEGIQQTVVPYVVRMIALVLSWFHFTTEQSFQTLTVRSSSLSAGSTTVYISWNCIGWQSFLLFLLTLFTGLQGNFTLRSKIMALLYGFLGTFWINVFRISFIVLVAHWWGRLPAILFHDYGSTILVIVWLFVYWWTAYGYVLEKNPTES